MFLVELSSRASRCLRGASRRQLLLVGLLVCVTSGDLGPLVRSPEPWQRVSEGLPSALVHPFGPLGEVRACPGPAGQGSPTLGRRAHRGVGEGVTWAQLRVGDVKC